MTARADLATALASAILRRAVTCALIALALGMLAAAIVVLGDLRDELRTTLRLPLSGWPRNLGAALDIALNNTRLAAGILICARAVPEVGVATRTALDAAVATVAACNAAVVGGALAAYGLRLAPLLALHVPFELAGLSLAGGAYLSAREEKLAARTLLAVGACCALLLAGGALLETYTPLAGAP